MCLESEPIEAGAAYGYVDISRGWQLRAGCSWGSHRPIQTRQ